MPIPSKQPGLTVTFFWRIGGSWPAGEILSLTSCPFILVDPACNRVVAFEKTCQVDRLPHLIRRSLSDTAFSTGYDRNGVNNYGISCLHIDQNENDIASWTLESCGPRQCQRHSARTNRIMSKCCFLYIRTVTTRDVRPNALTATGRTATWCGGNCNSCVRLT